MATPKDFGNRMHFDGDGCDPDDLRHNNGQLLPDITTADPYHAGEYPDCVEVGCKDHPWIL